MNMISTGAFLSEMDASAKQETLAEKFVRVWEKKNSKLVRTGGVSLMALTLAACGSDDATTAGDDGGSSDADDSSTVVVDTTGVSIDLSTSADTPELSANDDTIGAASGTLANTDLIVDFSSTDNDVLNATVTNATTAPRIHNIETVNLTGNAITVGLDLASTTSVGTVNASTALPAGTATFTNAAATSAGAIVAGSNVNTLDVTSAAAGTGAAGVNVTGGADTTAINVTGGAAADVFNVTTGVTAATVTLATMAAADTANISNGFAALTVDGVAAAAVGAMNVTSTVDSEVTVTTGIAATTDFLGDGNVTLATTSAIAATATAITSTGGGTLTLTMDTVTDGDDVSVAAVDVIDHADSTGAAGLTVLGSSTLNLDVDVASSTFDVSAAGSLTMTVSESQSNTVATGGNATSLIISATPDDADDLDADDNGTDEAVITISDLDTATGTNTETVVITGSADLSITTYTNDATASLTNSTAMTGDLTIGTTTAAGTFHLGSGDDNVTVGNVASTIRGNDGDDSITGGTAADTIFGGAGDDTIAGGGTNANTIDAGAGDDTITATAADTITVGAGADTVVGADDNGHTISDFDITEDLIVVTGTATASIDLGSITPTTGAYDFGMTGGADVTLTGVTATDATGFVQLGSATAAYIALDTGTLTAGDADDNISVATTESATITTGDGADTVTLASGAGSAVTVSDFTVGTDKVVITGAMSDGTSIDLDTIIPVAGAYTVDATAVVTITGATATDVSGYFQLGADGSALTLDNTSNAAGGISAYGSDFDDFFGMGTIGTTATTFYFTDGGGVDTVSGVVANDALSVVSFTDMAEITGTGTAVAANADKVADAADGAVYVFASAADGTGSEAIATFTENAANGITADVILADVAAFLDAGLGSAAGEHYVAVINDGTTMAYAYLVEGDADGIDADDLTLLGTIDETSGAAAITATDIA